MALNGPNNEIKDNEFNDLVQKGWLVVGTGANAGLYQLTTKGLAEYDRLVRSLSGKAQVLVGLKLASNAFTAPATIKGFMQQ
jgi:hypothetical protein